MKVTLPSNLFKELDETSCLNQPTPEAILHAPTKWGSRNVDSDLASNKTEPLTKKQFAAGPAMTQTSFEN